jgi:carboxylate-amine ligase
MPDESLTLGVEEEYQLLDAVTGNLRPASAAVLGAARSALGEEVQPELLRSQVEIATPICRTLDEISAELRRLRCSVGEAATEVGCRLGAAGTHPFAVWQDQQVTPKQRYLDLADEFQQVARETLIFGCHVHVGIADPELAIDVMNRVRPWLSALVALSTNSPFWAGVDTGYSSYRTEVFRRFPMTGTPHFFRGRRDYDDLVETLVATGAITDATRLYWDIRPSARFPTLEFRVSDVCLRVSETVALAGLVRGLVAAAADEAATGAPAVEPRPEVLEAAIWRAARYGMDDELVDPAAGRALPAVDFVGRALEFAGDALRAAGDWDLVTAAIEQLIEDGTGAQRQRAAFARRHHFDDVIQLIADETAADL